MYELGEGGGGGGGRGFVAPPVSRMLDIFRYTDDSAKNTRKKIFLKVASQDLVYRLLSLTNECFAAFQRR